MLVRTDRYELLIWSCLNQILWQLQSKGFGIVDKKNYGINAILKNKIDLWLTVWCCTKISSYVVD